MTSEPPPSPSPLDALRACQWVDVVEISEPESNSLRIVVEEEVIDGPLAKMGTGSGVARPRDRGDSGINRKALRGAENRVAVNAGSGLIGRGWDPRSCPRGAAAPERGWGQDPGSQGRGIAAILALTAKHSAAPKIASRSTLEAV